MNFDNMGERIDAEIARKKAANQRQARKERENADVAQALLALKETEGIRFYRHCCTVHGTNCSDVNCTGSKHAAFHRSSAKTRIVFGGNRSSKTYTACAELVFNVAFKVHPYTGKVNKFPCNARIMCSDFGVMEKLILPLLKEMMPKNALKDGSKFASKEEAWKNAYDNRYHILYLTGKSKIDFVSFDQDYIKSASVALDYVWSDEEMPERHFSEAMARLVSTGGRFVLSVTPLYGLTWAMKFLKSKDNPDVNVFKFSITDNPHLAAKDVQAFIDSIPEHEKEARIHGNFLELAGLVYKELDSDVHFIAESRKPEYHFPIIHALDPHPRKATVMTWAYVTPQEDLIFFDELEIKGTAAEIAAAIREKESKFTGKVKLRIIDPAAKAQGSNIAYQTDTLKEFEREGLSFSMADRSEAGYNVVHEYLGYDRRKPLSSTNRPQMYFTKDCPKTWEGMSSLLWDDYNFSRALRDEKEKVKDYKKDFPDCVRYTAVIRPTFVSRITPRPVQMRGLGYQKRNPNTSIFADPELNFRRKRD